VCSVGYFERRSDHVQPSQVTVNIPAVKWAKYSNYDSREVQLRGKDCKRYGEVINNVIKTTDLVCGYNVKRTWYINAKNVEQLRYMTIQGYCICGMKITVTITEKPLPGRDVAAIINLKGDFKLVQTKETGREVARSTRAEYQEILERVPAQRLHADHYAKVDLMRYLHGNNLEK